MSGNPSRKHTTQYSVLNLITFLKSRKTAETVSHAIKVSSDYVK